MYIPNKYLEQDWEAQEELIQKYPLGTVVTTSENGEIIANHIPFFLHKDKDSGKKYLHAHIAKVNHQIPTLKGSDNVLIIFQSHDCYITPSYYPSKKETHKFVPTWDFASVHVYGKSKIIDEFDFVRKQLNSLTNQQERSRNEPWKVNDAPENYLQLLQKTITGLEIEITRTESKFKFEQKMKRQEIDGVIEGLAKDNLSEASELVKLTNERFDNKSSK